MPTSDSEDFESADEGHGSVEKKERKKRNSSSNYSDNALETVAESKPTSSNTEPQQKSKEKVNDAEGWDDFDIEEEEVVLQPSNKPDVPDKHSLIENTNFEIKPTENMQDTEWNDSNWGDEDDNKVHDGIIDWDQPRASNHDADLKQMTDKLAAMSTAPSSTSWGWGWGVDSILSTASAGLSNFTNQVSQGINTVLETGIGAPDPEELARKSSDREGDTSKPRTPSDQEKPEQKPEEGSARDAFDPFGSILKFVGSTGSKVITGGLDTLETIGRKTYEVLQEGDPHLAKKRTLLGLDPGTPVLSQVLREAKAKAEEEDKVREERREAKEIHYERLFDDFEGLVHLEALEMLAKQVNMQIEERLQNAAPSKKHEMKLTLQQVSELCEIQEESEDDEDEEEKEDQTLPKDEVFHERLQKATEDLGVKLQFQPLVKQYKEILDWASNPESDFSLKSIHKRAVGSLAQATALSVEIYHKAAEMLMVKPRRMTADECDAMTQMTQVLCKHISELAKLYSSKLHELITTETASDAKTCITNIFLQADNSSTYIKNAFILTHPILQVDLIY